ncbi:hypothetical protein OIU74_010122, partial [Salix koriyanagi]
MRRSTVCKGRRIFWPLIQRSLQL